MLCEHGHPLSEQDHAQVKWLQSELKPSSGSAPQEATVRAGILDVKHKMTISDACKQVGLDHTSGGVRARVKKYAELIKPRIAGTLASGASSGHWPRDWPWTTGEARKREIAFLNGAPFTDSIMVDSPIGKAKRLRMDSNELRDLTELTELTDAEVEQQKSDADAEVQKAEDHLRKMEEKGKRLEAEIVVSGFFAVLAKPPPDAIVHLCFAAAAAAAAAAAPAAPPAAAIAAGG